MASKNIEVPFAMQEGDAGVVQNSRETLINMYLEVGTSGRSQVVRRQRPGLHQIHAVAGEKRCIERHRNSHFMIIGTGFYEFDGSTLTLRGSIVSNTGRCTMVFNDNDQVMVSDGSRAWYWNGTALQLVSVPTGVKVGNLSYISGYAIFNDVGTGKFYITAPNDFSAVDALDFATAESSPDSLVATFVDHNELWMAGDHTTEVWQLTGGADFPFTPFSNAQLERGCAAALSYAAEDNTVFFLGDDLIVYRADGYRPVRVSSHPVEEALAKCDPDAISRAYATIFTWRGNKFYVLTVPEQLSVALNIGTGLWSRFKTFGSDSWDMIGSAGHQSDYYLTNAGICTLKAVNTDETGTMYRGARSAPGYAEGRRISIPEFWLDAEVGRAATGEEARVMLRVALDGETFGNERWRSLGSTGDYARRAVWRNLGQGRKPVIEVGATDDFEFSIISARAGVVVASS